MAKRTALQAEADKVIVKDFYLEGWTSAAIAEHISGIRPYTLSHKTILADINEIKAEMEASLSMEVKGHISRQLASIEKQEAELWEAWKRSKSKSVETVEEPKSDGKGKVKKMVVTKRVVKERDGDHSFMARIAVLNDQRRAILGLDQPKRQILQDPEGNSLEFIVRLAENELP